MTSGKAENSSDVIIWELLDQNWNMVANVLGPEAKRNKEFFSLEKVLGY